MNRLEQEIWKGFLHDMLVTRIVFRILLLVVCAVGVVALVARFT